MRSTDTKTYTTEYAEKYSFFECVDKLFECVWGGMDGWMDGERR